MVVQELAALPWGQQLACSRSGVKLGGGSVHPVWTVPAAAPKRIISVQRLSRLRARIEDECAFLIEARDAVVVKCREAKLAPGRQARALAAGREGAAAAPAAPGEARGAHPRLPRRVPAAALPSSV